jgi:hypothetical protein
VDSSERSGSVNGVRTSVPPDVVNMSAHVKRRSGSLEAAPLETGSGLRDHHDVVVSHRCVEHVEIVTFLLITGASNRRPEECQAGAAAESVRWWP